MRISMCGKYDILRAALNIAVMCTMTFRGRRLSKYAEIWSKPFDTLGADREIYLMISNGEMNFGHSGTVIVGLKFSTEMKLSCSGLLVGWGVNDVAKYFPNTSHFSDGEDTVPDKVVRGGILIGLFRIRRVMFHNEWSVDFAVCVWKCNF